MGGTPAVMDYLISASYMQWACLALSCVLLSLRSAVSERHFAIFCCHPWIGGYSFTFTVVVLPLLNPEHLHSKKHLLNPWCIISQSTVKFIIINSENFYKTHWNRTWSIIRNDVRQIKLHVSVGLTQARPNNCCTRPLSCRSALFALVDLLPLHSISLALLCIMMLFCSCCALLSFLLLSIEWVSWRATLVIPPVPHWMEQHSFAGMLQVLTQLPYPYQAQCQRWCGETLTQESCNGGKLEKARRITSAYTPIYEACWWMIGEWTL